MILKNLHVVSFFEGRERNLIPGLVHLIDLSSSTITPENVTIWANLMPTYTIRLWTSSDLISSEFSTTALNLISQATTNDQKSRIMRFFILEKYGGIFLDIAMIPHRSLDPMFHVPNSQIALSHPDIVNEQTTDLNIDVLGSTPNHSFISRCCTLLSTMDPTHVLAESLRTETSDEMFSLYFIRQFYKNLKNQTWIDGSIIERDDMIRFATLM